MLDARVLVTVASIVSAFALTTMMFRIQRELAQREQGLPTYIAWSDWLLLSAMVGCMLFVVVPLVSTEQLPPLLLRVPGAFCCAAAFLVVGYIFGILAHYRLLFWRGHGKTPHVPGEPAERVIVVFFGAVALAAFVRIVL
ncbi:MAG TPA: hypothetical protein VGK20_07480 [Candidatus Binatia bacterium]|jgi:hypothetical protein